MDFLSDTMDPEEYLRFCSERLVDESHAGVLSPKSHETSPAGFSLFFSSQQTLPSTVGNCRTFLGGRVVVGPRWDGLIGSLMFLSALDGLILWLVVWPGRNTFWVTFICLFSMMASFLFFFLTSLSNPGIVPRNTLFDAEAMKQRVSPQVDANTGLLRPRYLLINGVCIRQKFCRTCKIYRPPRSNHCSSCDNCVLKFDHHCPSLGTCVGLGNYRWFLCLVFWLTVEGVSVFAMAVRELLDSEEDIEFSSFEWENINYYSAFVLAVVSGVAVIAFALLLLYHGFVAAHNLTTNEHLKKYYKVNPFDVGCWVNWMHCLVTPHLLLPQGEQLDQLAASYKELASTNSECVSDFYDY